MIIQNNSSTRTYTVGGVTIDPGKQATVSDEYYDDIQGITDLQLIGVPPVNTAAMTRRSTQTLYNSDGTVYGIVSSDGIVSVTGRINPFTVGAGQNYSFAMKEGDFLTLTGNSTAAGVLTRTGALSTAIGTGTTKIGPFSGVQMMNLATSAGSIDAVVGDAVLPSSALNIDSFGTLLAIPTNGAQTPQFYGSNIAIMGDSIAQQNTTIVSGSMNYNQRGPVCSAMCYLGWPWTFEPSDNIAVFGSTLDAIIDTQLPNLAALHATRRYSRVFLSCGTNDTNAGTPLDQIKTYFTRLFKGIRALGIIPVHTGIRPRSTTDVATTVAKQKNQQLNEWLYQLSRSGVIEFIDTTEAYADNTTAFGNILAALVYDAPSPSLHPNGRGAMLEGKAIADYYLARGIQPQMKFATMQSDVFDRVNNITGVAFNNPNPLMQGGTTTPTGMTTTGGTWSKVARALPNGQNRSDPSCVMAASTLHHLYDDWVGSGDWGATQLQSGDVLEGRAKILITNGVNLQFAQIRASINNGVTATLHYGLFGDGSSIPDGNHTLYLKTPRFVIPSYGGSGNVAMFMRAEVQTLAGGSGTLTVQGFEMRKVG